MAMNFYFYSCKFTESRYKKCHKILVHISKKKNWQFYWFIYNELEKCQNFKIQQMLEMVKYTQNFTKIQ